VIICTHTEVQQTLFEAVFQDDALFLEITNINSVSELPRILNLGDDSRQAFLAAIKCHQKERRFTCAFLKADSNQRVHERLLKLVAFDQSISRKVVARLSLILGKASSCIRPSFFLVVVSSEGLEPYAG
jgi:hypothetical protein